MARLQSILPWEQRLDICAQHWANSFRCALDDAGEDTLVLRFEDIVHNARGRLIQIAEFTGLPFRENLVPSAGDVLPLGSRFPDRWYPLDPERSRRGLEGLSGEDIDIIAARCGPIARRFGYGPR